MNEFETEKFEEQFALDQEPQPGGDWTGVGFLAFVIALIALCCSPAIVHAVWAWSW